MSHLSLSNSPLDCPSKKKKKKKKNSPLDSDMAKYGIRGYNKVNLWHALHIRALQWVNVKKSESKQNWLEEKKKKNSSQERLSVRVSQTTQRQPQPKKGRESIGIERVSSNDELVQIIGGHDPSPLHCVPPPQDSHHEILCWYILCSCSIASSFSFSLLPFQVNVAWLCCSCMVLIWFQLMLQ